MSINQRLQSLDVFRGATMAAMLVVENPGSWRDAYPSLHHAPWGRPLTPTDWILPFFLFIVGVAIPLALDRRIQAGAPRTAVVGAILRRGALLFVLGLLFYLYPRFDLAHMRIPGVLQTIAVVYVSCALLHLHTSWRVHAGIAAGLLVLQWLVLTLVPVPGHGAPMLQPGANLASWLDATLLGAHLRRPHASDPMGVVVTLSAISTGLMGMLAGQWLRQRHQRAAADTTVWMLIAGCGLVLAGWAGSSVYPMIKNLWTSTYSLYTSGLALLAFALCFWFVDVLHYRRWTWPLVVVGVNCLAVYVAQNLVARTSSQVIRWDGADGATVSLHELLYGTGFASWLAPANASLLFAVTVLVLWWLVLWLLYRKHIMIRV